MVASLLHFLGRLLIYTFRPGYGLSVPQTTERRRLLIEYEQRQREFEQV